MLDAWERDSDDDESDDGFVVDAAPPPAPPPAPAASQAARPDPPDALVCPISMELMEDPVLAMDGHTYDRSSIEAWLKTGKKTSPKTNAPLPSLTLVPNHAVKSMVQDYLNPPV